MCCIICHSKLHFVLCVCILPFSDIDECHELTGSNDCAGNASCTNGPGNYSCTCKNGFEGDPRKGCTGKFSSFLLMRNLVIANQVKRFCVIYCYNRSLTLSSPGLLSTLNRGRLKQLPLPPSHHRNFLVN